MNLKELDSFRLADAVTFHDELNPKLWNGMKLRPEVKKQLKIIADDFMDELGISGLDVVDLTVSGSNAAYSYTPHSDLDLHLLVDMSDMPNDEVYKELFNAKKNIYNDTHNITIHGVPVEVYVQDASQPVVSLGEYSIKNDDWIKLPTKRRANFDQTATKQKYEKLSDIVNSALKSKNLGKINKIIKKIRQYRQAGLDKGGEFGPENLAYKALRSQGYIDKLYQLRDKLHSELLTIENMYQDPVKIQEKINSQVTKKDFYAEKDINIKDVGPLKLVAYNISDDYPQQFKIDVIHPDGKKIGYFRFVIHDYEPEPKFKLFSKFKDKKDPYVLAGNVSVWNEFQKKGIASEVYKWVKSMGNDIKPSNTQTPAGKAMWRGFEKNQIADEDYDPNGPPPGPEFKPTMPAGTVRVDVSDVYDWYKLGQHISNMKGLGKHDFGAGPPSTILAFGDEDTEHKYIKDLEKTGLTTTDIDPVDPKQPKGMKRQKVDPTYNVKENDTMQFAASKTPAINRYGGLKDRQYRGAIAEAFDQPYPIKWEKSEYGDYDAMATLPDGKPLTIMFNHESPDEVVITFWRNNNLELTGEGDAQRVFATVLQAIQEFLKMEQPATISFSASKEVEPGQNTMSRSKLYDRLVSRYAQQWGYNAQSVDHEEGVVYNLSRKQNVSEASGYIPSEKEKNDPRFKTALTVDVKPDSIKKNAKSFYWKTSRAGIPPTAKPSGKF